MQRQGRYDVSSSDSVEPGGIGDMEILTGELKDGHFHGPAAEEMG